MAAAFRFTAGAIFFTTGGFTTATAGGAAGLGAGGGARSGAGAGVAGFFRWMMVFILSQPVKESAAMSQSKTNFRVIKGMSRFKRRDDTCRKACGKSEPQIARKSCDEP